MYERDQKFSGWLDDIFRNVNTGLSITGRVISLVPKSTAPKPQSANQQMLPTTPRSQVPSWAIGSFNAIAPDGRNIILTLTADGWVNAQIGTGTIIGTYSNGTLYIGDATSNVTQTAAGIDTIRPDNGQNINYSRVGVAPINNTPTNTGTITTVDPVTGQLITNPALLTPASGGVTIDKNLILIGGLGLVAILLIKK